MQWLDLAPLPFVGDVLFGLHVGSLTIRTEAVSDSVVFHRISFPYMDCLVGHHCLALLPSQASLLATQPHNQVCHLPWADDQKKALAKAVPIV